VITSPARISSISVIHRDTPRREMTDFEIHHNAGPRKKNMCNQPLNYKGCPTEITGYIK